MGHLLIESITEPLRVFCNILAFVIPFVINKINHRLHQWGDPPWKRDKVDTKSKK